MDAERTVHVGEYNPTETDNRMPWEIDVRVSIPPTTEEYAVTTAASLAQYLLHKDRTVGFATYGQHYESIQGDRGARQLTKILETLAVIRARGTMPLDQLLTLECNQLAQGTTVIVITPSTREGWTATAHRLLRRGLRVIAVLIDPESFGGRPGMRHTALHLNSISIPTYLVQKDDNLSVALSRQRA